MELLLRQVKIVDPSSPFHQHKTDILIKDGFVSQIGDLSVSAEKVVERPGLSIAPGFTDPFAHFCDPGFEYRETLESGAAGAARGGYTRVMVMPNTSPVVHNKAGVEYIIQRSRPLPVTVLPIGAVTRNTEGKELAEMYDMHASGAVAFSDGIKTIQSGGLLLKSLQYLKAIDGVLIQLPDDLSISPNGLMNEGVLSTTMGLPGKPAIAEELMVRRDIELAAYTGSRLHLTGISSAGAVELVRQAKAKGIAVTASVTPYHLYFTEQDLDGYDTNLKVNPPLRSAADRDALRAGLLDGTIDCIATHHLPHDTDHKVVEFEYAHFGMLGLETAFAAVVTAIPGISDEKLAEVFAINPAKIFNLELSSITEGARASFTLFEKDAAWEVPKPLSRSSNSAFTGKQLKGRTAGIINKDQLFLND